MAYPRHRRSRAHKFFIRTAGDITLSSAALTWTDLPTITTSWDASLQAQVGDTLEASISGVIDAAAVISYFDVQTIVASTPTNSFGSQTTVANANKGVVGWYCAINVLNNLSGSAMYAVVAGDISGGLVTCRLRQQQASTTTRNLHATVDYPLQFSVKNLGPPSAH